MALGRGRRLNRPRSELVRNGAPWSRPAVFRRVRVNLTRLNRSQLAYKCFRRGRGLAPSVRSNSSTESTHWTLGPGSAPLEHQLRRSE
eukprot:4626090-Prymnesium_polylepis.1